MSVVDKEEGIEPTQEPIKLSDGDDDAEDIEDDGPVESGPVGKYPFRQSSTSH